MALQTGEKLGLRSSRVKEENLSGMAVLINKKYMIEN
jgi:hypothetical protein